MVGLVEITAIREEMGAYAAAFEPGLVTARDALGVLEQASTIENMAATVKALAARRVAETALWRERGDRDPARFLARKTGIGTGQARGALETAERLGQLPEVDRVARAGELSAPQAEAISEAATADPGAELRLVHKARSASLGELREECERTKAASDPDAEARHRRIHAARFARRRRCADGAGELTYRSTLEEVARVWAVIQGYANQAFHQARREARREPAEAYAADGLLAMARAAAGAGPANDLAAASAAADANANGSTAGNGNGANGNGATAGPRLPAPTKVIARIDWDALVRGWLIAGETCEVAGLGPVPVSVVRAMTQSGDAFLAAVVTKGVDVATVAHLGRRPTAHQQTALQWRDPTCTVLGCDAVARLETDHRHDWADTKVTLLGWLDRFCDHHHDLKTYEGWALVEGTGKRPMVPPDHPDHPDHPRHGQTARAP